MKRTSKAMYALFIVLAVLLVAFFGVGIAFCFYRIWSAGLLGIGLALIGAGVTLLMADGVLFHRPANETVDAEQAGDESLELVAETPSAEPDVRAYRLQVSCQKLGLQAEQTDVQLKADCLDLPHFGPTGATIRMKDITDISWEKADVVISGVVLAGSYPQTDVATFTFPSAIRAKAFFALLTERREAEKKDEEGIEE